MIAFAFFFSIVLGIISLVHLAVYKFLLAVFATALMPHLTVFRTVFVVLALSFLVLTIVSVQYSNIVIKVLYNISAYWMGLLYFLFVASILYALIALIPPLAPYLSRIGLAFVVIAGVLTIYSAYRAFDVQVTRYDVRLPNTPEAWKGKKAVLVADMHLGNIRSTAFSQKIADLTNTERADIVLLAGDVYDGVKIDEKASVAPLATITAPWGVYFASGNHEELHGSPIGFFEGLRNAGVTVLNNEKRTVQGVDIIGVDYQSTEDAIDYTSVLTSLTTASTTPTILIKHVPLHLEVPEAAGIDLAVSGHTHHAQLYPLSYITKKIYQGYDYGMKAYGTMTQITTSGAGTWGPPFRIGTKAEIVVITFL